MGGGRMWPSLIKQYRLDRTEMGQTRDAPTAEQVANAAGGDVETAEQALLSVRFSDDTYE